MRFAGFDWDEGNWPKCGKHGVSRAEIEQVLLGQPLTMVDPHPLESQIMSEHTKKLPKKPFPLLLSDEDAEHFVETADLTEYDLSQFQPVRFELTQPKSAAITMRLPPALLTAVKQAAETAGMPYTRYIRLLLEQAVARSPSARR
jgi:predicted DNA binding CopG/RHH family protein